MSKLSHTLGRSSKGDQALDITLTSALGSSARRELKLVKREGQMRNDGSLRGNSSNSD